MNWKEEINSLVRPAQEIEEFVDVAWQRFARHLGIGQPRQILAYHGYSNAERAWIEGRVISNRVRGGPKEDDCWWENLVASYARWESDEVPGVQVHLRYGEWEEIVTTDAEGYYRAEFPVSGSHDVVATHIGKDTTISASHTVMSLPDDAQFLLVSDVDDTVIHTGITDLLLAAQLTFLNNARTRKPLKGAAVLYRALGATPAGRLKNPVFYLSNSAWNMYDLLRDFLELNDFPSGPLLLRDLGLGTDSSQHKSESIAALLERFDPLPLVLIGDSGQHDTEIYAHFVERTPDRIKAVYIRDIEPDRDSDFARKVDDIIVRIADSRVPFLRVQTSVDIARHAVEAGLLRANAMAKIAKDTDADRKREPL